jgi:hypothetical protein
MVLFFAAIGVAGGVAQARRGYPRSVSIALLLAVAIMVAGGSATRWDWKTQTTPLGGSADYEKRMRLEALGMAEHYTGARQTWMAMTNSERWAWRRNTFALVSLSLLGGAVPTMLLMTKRANR